MKYIKCFENSNNNYYTNISIGEYVDAIKLLDDREEFVNYEKAKLDKFANSFGPSIYDMIHDMVTTRYTSENTICIFKAPVTRCRIFKLKDDYFIVMYVNLLVGNERKYIKCDQFDGLLKCLSDNKEYICNK